MLIQILSFSSIPISQADSFFFFFGAEFIQPIPLFLTINEAAVMLCATMNEIKHCAG